MAATNLPAGLARRAAYFLGEEGVAALSAEQALAFAGLLEAGRRLARQLEGDLEASHGIGLSALGLLGRLAAAPDSTLRLTTLAQDMGLSLSRVSRIVGALERRGLLQRQRCEADARATNACLTAEGAALARTAQATHAGSVQRHFLSKLDEQLLGALGAACDQLLDGADPDCTPTDWATDCGSTC